MHVYDFNKNKFNEIKKYLGTDKYESLVNLLRFPGVRILRAELYYNSGLTIEAISKSDVKQIQSVICKYLEENKLNLTIPTYKEIRTHQEVAKMILNIAII